MKISLLLSLIVLPAVSIAQHEKLADLPGSLTGTYPLSHLYFDGSFLYGTTNKGGADDFGTLFKIAPDGSSSSTLHEFPGYADGMYLSASFISDGTWLYGTTYGGGTGGAGIFFRIKPDGSEFSKLFDFDSWTCGSAPFGTLLSDGTFFYGTAWGGGIYSKGTLFKIKPDGTQFMKLRDLPGTPEACYPKGSLISDGTYLYGTTEMGGTNDLGTLFRIKPDGNGYSKLYDFTGSANGSHPRGALLSLGMYLYGLTYEGGTDNLGVIFRINPDGTGYEKLMDFTGTASGSNPAGSLISDGIYLWGMTQNGGANDLGVIFRILPDGNHFSKVFEFSGITDGSHPCGDLICDGTYLYGTTNTGGISNQGTIFRYALPTGVPANGELTEIEVYPNPAMDKITVRNEKVQMTNDRWEVINVYGECVISGSANTASFDIDLSSVLKGVYVLRMVCGDKTSSHKVVVR
jgi:uncharacterized repeat protein (TIGR03803 family)